MGGWEQGGTRGKEAACGAQPSRELGPGSERAKGSFHLTPALKNAN